MGNCRFFYDNLITATMLSVSTVYQKKGIVTAPYKEGAGSGGLTPYGDYDHYEDLEYVVEIDATDGGNDVGQAEFRWRDGSTWDASTVLTGSSIALSHDIKINFTTGAGNDFELGDIWYFKGINPFKLGNLLDGNLDTKWKTSSGTTYYDFYIDLGNLTSANVMALSNHNLSSLSTIHLVTYDSSNWSTIIQATQVVWSTGIIVHYLTSMTTAQYWGFQIRTSSGYNIEIGEFFLGRYWEPSDNFAVDSEIPINILNETQYTQAGIRKDIHYNIQKQINLVFPYMKTTDKETFETMINTISDSITKQYKPVWFNMDSTLTDQTWLMEIGTPLHITQHKARYTIRMNLEEVLKSG